MITVGQVTRNGKTHLNLHGLAACGAGTGRIIAATIHEITPADTGHVCRRCAAKIQTRIVNEAWLTSRRTDRGSVAARNRLLDMADALRTPAEIEREARMISGIAANMATAA